MPSTFPPACMFQPELNSCLRRQLPFSCSYVVVLLAGGDWRGSAYEVRACDP